MHLKIILNTTTTTGGDSKPAPPLASSNHGINNNAGGGGTIPKCVWSWKNCRVYQKFFREHPVWHIVIKLKLTNTEPEAMVLKKSLDRILKVPDAKAQDWKAGKGGSEVSSLDGNTHSKFRADPKHYSFVKPFSIHGAQKYLFLNLIIRKHSKIPRETMCCICKVRWFRKKKSRICFI